LEGEGGGKFLYRSRDVGATWILFSSGGEQLKIAEEGQCVTKKGKGKKKRKGSHWGYFAQTQGGKKCFLLQKYPA